MTVDGSLSAIGRRDRQGGVQSEAGTMQARNSARSNILPSAGLQLSQDKAARDYACKITTSTTSYKLL